MDKLTSTALRNAAGTTLYVIAVASFLFYGGQHGFGKENVVFIPIAFLLLFVLSASVTSYLMLGKPAQLYLDGKKKEALTLLTKTILFFAAFTLVALFLLFFYRG